MSEPSQEETNVDKNPVDTYRFFGRRPGSIPWMATAVAALMILITTGAWELWYSLPRSVQADIPAMVEAVALLPFAVAAPFLATRLSGGVNWIARGIVALIVAWSIIFAAFMVMGSDSLAIVRDLLDPIVIGGWSMSTLTAALISSVALALPPGGRGWLLLRLAIVAAAIGASALQELTDTTWPNAGLLIGTVLLAWTSRTAPRPVTKDYSQA